MSLKGVFNLQTPLPISWDIDTALKFIKTWYPYESLLLIQLTLKANFLVALVSAQRAQSIHNMDIDVMTKTQREIVFPI